MDGYSEDGVKSNWNGAVGHTMKQHAALYSNERSLAVHPGQYIFCGAQCSRARQNMDRYVAV